jgi:hypothetical protein
MNRTWHFGEAQGLFFKKGHIGVRDAGVGRVEKPGCHPDKSFYSPINIWFEYIRR